tara:strand:+ start:166 stop:372 length:207 start_codon:yes stop_codon:yes gene_type:complete
MNKFLAVGDQTCTSRVERIEFQEGIIFSAMRSQILDWQIPGGWDDLTLDEKEARIKDMRNRIKNLLTH